MPEEARDVGDQRQEFIEQQLSGLGATDSPKILNLSKYGTALTVYERLQKISVPSEMGLPAWLGLRLQAVVGEMFSQAMGVKLRADNKHHRHFEHDWMTCHLDFRVWGQPKTLVEVKTKAYMRGWGEDGSTEIPADVYVQCQHEMAVTGADICYVAVLFGHHTYRTYPIKRDQGFIDKLIPRLEDFWFKNHLAGVPPLPTGHDLDDESLRRQYADHDETLKAATPEQEVIIGKLRSARLNVAQAEGAKAEIENRVKLMIGSAAGILGAFGRITWKKSKDTVTTDFEQLAITYANVIEDLFLMARPGDDPQEVARLARAQSVFDTAVGLATYPKLGSRRFLVDFAEED